MQLSELRTWAEVDLDALENNVEAIRSRIGEARLLAVAKADGYGHGAAHIAAFLADKVDYLAVAMTDEALELRHKGIRLPILILGFSPRADYPLLVRYDITPTLYDEGDAAALNAVAAAEGRVARAHIAVDTGMSRIGFADDEVSLEAVVRIAALPNVHIEGIFSHYAAADEPDKGYTDVQTARFERFAAALAARGVSIPLRHMHNSAGIVDLEPRFDMVRAGIILYGLHPSDAVCMENLPPLRGVMSVRAAVNHVKTLEAGISVSYGCTFTTTRTTKVATVCIGYADGYPRALSNKGTVIIHGHRAPVIGRVCMDMLMIDVTDVPEVAVGDVVTLFGADGGETVTADEVAAAAGTIGYELICGISKRMPRVYIRGGQIIEIGRHLPHE